MTLDRRVIAEFTQALIAMNEAWAKVVSQLQEQDYLPLETAAELTGMTKRQLSYRAQNGSVKSKKVGRTVYLCTSDLDKYIPSVQAGNPRSKHGGL